MATYLTFEVFEFQPYNVFIHDIINPTHIEGDESSKQQRISVQQNRVGLKYDLLQANITERATIRDFFLARSGGTSVFWVRSYKIDLEFAIAEASGQTVITLKDNDWAIGLPTNRHIYIPSLDQYAEITNTVTAGDDTDVTISPGLTGDIPINAVIEFLYLVRFDANKFSFIGINASEYTKVSFKFIEEQESTP